MDFTRITHVHVNQGYRPCAFLAALADKALIEYEMPNGSTALVELAECEKCQGAGTVLVEREVTGECRAYGCWGKGYKRLRAISYSVLPRYWIEAIVKAENEHELLFTPQQSDLTKVAAAFYRFNEIVGEFQRANAKQEPDAVRIYFKDGTDTIIHVLPDDEIQAAVVALCEENGWSVTSVAHYAIEV